MQGPFYTKKDLYNIVEDVRKRNSIEAYQTKDGFYKYCAQLKYDPCDVGYVDLSSRNIRGVSVPKDRIILLNEKRSPIEQNFDSSHEFFHVVLHKHTARKSFNCFDDNQPKQDPILEWQANEAGAELLVPYRTFIPEFFDGFSRCSDFFEYWFFVDNILPGWYNVTDTVIRNRIDALKYEISQYENGVPVEHVEILSDRQQKARNIIVPSYHDRFSV